MELFVHVADPLAGSVSKAWLYGVSRAVRPTCAHADSVSTPPTIAATMPMIDKARLGRTGDAYRSVLAVSTRRASPRNERVLAATHVFVMTERRERFRARRELPAGTCHESGRRAYPACSCGLRPRMARGGAAGRRAPSGSLEPRTDAQVAGGAPASDTAELTIPGRETRTSVGTLRLTPTQLQAKARTVRIAEQPAPGAPSHAGSPHRRPPCRRLHATHRDNEDRHVLPLAVRKPGKSQALRTAIEIPMDHRPATDASTSTVETRLSNWTIRSRTRRR
jgi:hypothetical protein